MQMRIPNERETSLITITALGQVLDNQIGWHLGTVGDDPDIWGKKVEKEIVFYQIIVIYTKF